MTEDTRRFAILMPWGRVGSNLVAATLNRRRDIRIDNEPTTRIRTFGERDGVPQDEQARQQMAELDVFLGPSEDKRRAGLKLSYRSLLEPGAYLGRLRSAGVPLVLMMRANHLKCAVSQLRARARAEEKAGQWQSPWAVRADEPKPGAVELDCAEVIRLTGLFQRLHGETLASVREVFGEAWLGVEYAELAADPQRELRRICEWFGIEGFDTFELPHRKATSDDLAEDVLNYEELAERAREAGYGALLRAGDG